MTPNNRTPTPPPLATAADTGTAARNLLTPERLAVIRARDAAYGGGKITNFSPEEIWERHQLLQHADALQAAHDAQAAEVAGLRAERAAHTTQLAEIVERWENSGPDMLPHDTDEMFARRLVLHEEYFTLLRAELGLPTEGAARA